MAFTGFPRQTVEFLADLSDNNDKAWFDAHRADYETFWVEPAKSFVETAGEALQAIADVSYEPRINGSIWRINRDVRFSKDKTPYKDHLDMSFWVGSRKAATSGFYLRITPDSIGVGAGCHGFTKDQLTRYRNAVADEAGGPALLTAARTVEAAGYDVKGEHYKRVPSGFEDVDADRERFLRHSALWTGEDRPHPKELFGPGFVDFAISEWGRQLPIHDWLVANLG